MERRRLEKKHALRGDFTGFYSKAALTGGFIRQSDSQGPCRRGARKHVWRSQSNSRAQGSPGAWPQCGRAMAGTSSSSAVYRPQHCCIAERPTPQDLHSAAGLGLCAFTTGASGVPPSHRRCHWLLEGSTFIWGGGSVIQLPLGSFSQAILGVLRRHTLWFIVALTLSPTP